MSYDQYIQWYKECKQNEIMEAEMLESIFPTIKEDDSSDEFSIDFTYCSNCEKNCVIQLDGYTQCQGCKNILVTDLKKIRRTYVTKSRQNKINHFTNALNEYLRDTCPHIHDVQQIVDIFIELVDFIRLTNTQRKLPNINAKFFIEKILRSFGFRIPPKTYRLKKKNARESNNEKIWNRFEHYKKDKSYIDSDIEEDMDDIPQCLSYGIFPSNSIKSVSLIL